MNLETISHYRILDKLGAGGMGEVYLAEDTRLRRKVALKLLPAEFTRDAARVRRFEQEARAASALNHPNIITIHEIGEENGAHYIATEFIDGQTLRERLAEKLTINAALDIAVQIAAALAAAHEAGITHRDIKPENVMLRRDGIVKVLDFGLAKLTEQRPDAVDSEAPTIAKVNTDPGTVMGTASYMSPEQARGLEVDARSDIFSFGVVLYETLTGRAPFAGVNAVDVMGAILNREPAPLNALAPEAPAELQRIVTKALRKDRDERYQFSKELLLDLKSLKQELEIEARLKGRPSSEAAQTAGLRAEETAGIQAARTTSSAEYLIGEIKRHKTGALIGLTALLACVALLAYGLYRLAAPRQEHVRFQNVKFTRLTAVGDAGRGASISPDGKLICYVLVEGGKLSLWTKAIATGSLVQLVPPSEVAELGDTTFSPDGNFVYYRAQEKGGQSTLYQIPALGGASKKILTNIRGAITFSPDGRQFAFMRRRDPETGNPGPLVVVNADGSGARALISNQGQSRLGLINGPSWSPDGSLIAFAGALNESGTNQTVMGVVVKTGEIKPLTEQKWENVFRVAWFRDGSGLAFVARESGSPNSQLFRLSFPGGEARRITNDLNSYGITTLSLTADAKSLLAVQGYRSSDIWVGSMADARRARQLTRQLSVRNSEVNGIAWTPDGRIVYDSPVSGNFDLWLMDSAGGNPRQLTDSPAADQFPVVSPDGRYIVFNSMRSGKLNLWRVEINGDNLQQLTSGELERFPSFSPDGRWVLYDSWTSGNLGSLWKIALEGGSPAPLNEGNGSRPVVSPDGKLIAYTYSDRQQGQRHKVGVIPFAGGAPVKILDYTPAPPARVSIRWTSDGRSLIYIDADQGGANLWRLPIDGSPPQPLTDFKNEQIWSFDVTRDGKQFVVARGAATSDVVLISEVK